MVDAGTVGACSPRPRCVVGASRCIDSKTAEKNAGTNRCQHARPSPAEETNYLAKTVPHSRQTEAVVHHEESAIHEEAQNGHKTSKQTYLKNLPDLRTSIQIVSQPLTMPTSQPPTECPPVRPTGRVIRLRCRNPNRQVRRSSCVDYRQVRRIQNRQVRRNIASIRSAVFAPASRFVDAWRVAYKHLLNANTFSQTAGFADSCVSVSFSHYRQ